MAAGPDKALSLVAGAAGGYFNHVILDEVAALSMISLGNSI
jgi:DNA-binding transcriptional regulator LsrR (DeoR family)